MPASALAAPPRAAPAARDDGGCHTGSDVADTYLPDVAAAGNGQLKRWGDRTTSPIRVWIAPGDAVPGWRPEFGAAVGDGFAAWARVGLPVRFVRVAAAGDAELRVTWTDQLPGQQAGVTHWTADRDGRLTRVHVELATRASDGTRADRASMRRIALHELGHALGLEHSPDADDVMAAWVQVGALSERDRATVRLLYAPSGARCSASGARDSSTSVNAS